MKNHGCIAIGINQYHYIPALHYAQEDGEAVYHFLVEKGGFSQDHSLLFTDHSPDRLGVSTCPTRHNLLTYFSQLNQSLSQTQELLWFFVSAYGVTHQGEDYLIPIDGNLTDIVNTGISFRFLLESLKKSGSKNLLVLLDINRSQLNQSGQRIGENTVKLAQEMDIPLLLSCQPHQVSRETSALRHGFFTAALLEGLSFGETPTLNALENWLRQRLPALSERHLRPRQDPLLSVSDPSKIYQGILPNLGKTGQLFQEHHPVSSTNISPQPPINIHPPLGEINMESSRQKVGNNSGLNPNNGSETLRENPPTNGEKEPLKAEENEEMIANEPSFVKHLLVWCMGTAVFLLGVAIFVQKDAIFSPKSSPKTPVKETVKKTNLTSAGQGKSSEKPTNKNQTKPPAQSLIPPSPKVEKSPATISSGQSLLNQSKILLKDGSASSFNNAISLARQIPPNDPVYPEAQSDIQRWSGNILDIAKGRAAQGNYQEAIRAAEIVPDFSQPLRQETETLIKEWETFVNQEKENTAILNEAKAKIKRGVASSYSQAIEEVEKIKPDQLKYQDAQNLINEWSEVILKIAQLRASQGRFTQAIQAAELVPQKTSSYDAAQKGINEWKTKK